jgi:mannosyltransferase
MTEIDVVMDCIVFDLQRAGGISRYWLNLISGLAVLPDGPRLHILINERASSESAVKVFELARVNPRLTLHPYRERVLERIRQPVIPAALAGRALFHSSFHRTVAGMSNVLTIHDFAYEDLVGGWRALGQHWQKSQALSRSAAVVCVSESTRRDFKRRFPSYRKGPVEVILHGVEAHFRPLPAAQTRPSGDSRDYVLFVGRRNKQKNFWPLVEALKRLRHLRITIAGPPLEAEEQARIEADLAGRYTAHANVEDAELVELYRGALALVYPSQYEGFGLPVLEAMACGCPCIALRASSIPEVAGDGAILLEEATPESIANALEKTQDAEIRARLVASGLEQAARFSWARAAQEYRALYGAISK